MRWGTPLYRTQTESRQPRSIQQGQFNWLIQPPGSDTPRLRRHDGVDGFCERIGFAFRVVVVH